MKSFVPSPFVDRLDLVFSTFNFRFFDSQRCRPFFDCLDLVFQSTDELDESLLVSTVPSSSLFPPQLPLNNFPSTTSINNGPHQGTFVSFLRHRHALTTTTSSKPPASRLEERLPASSSPPRPPARAPPPPVESRSLTATGPERSPSARFVVTRSRPSSSSASSRSSLVCCLARDLAANSALPSSASSASSVRSPRTSRPTFASSPRPSWLFRSPPRPTSSPSSRSESSCPCRRDFLS